MNTSELKSIQKRIRNRIESSIQSESLAPSIPEGAKVVYLMRGLPSCGKSTTAKKLAGENGVVIETDAFFQTPGLGPKGYSFDRSRLPEARAWTFDLFRDAIGNGVSTIVIDRGNGSNSESKAYADLALENGYQLKIQEPESEWWDEIRVLLRYRPATNELLDEWAEELSRLSERTHRVDFETIRHWMDCWVDDLTVEDILAV